MLYYYILFCCGLPAWIKVLRHDDDDDDDDDDTLQFATEKYRLN